MSEYIVDFGDDGKSAVRIAMAKQHVAQVRGEIVRCGDCEHYHPELCDIGRASCQLWIKPSEPDGYCAWGERRSINCGD